jgi:hypothetical protein
LESGVCIDRVRTNEALSDSWRFPTEAQNVETSALQIM